MKNSDRLTDYSVYSTPVLQIDRNIFMMSNLIKFGINPYMRNQDLGVTSMSSDTYDVNQHNEIDDNTTSNYETTNEMIDIIKSVFHINDTSNGITQIVKPQTPTFNDIFKSEVSLFFEQNDLMDELKKKHDSEIVGNTKVNTPIRIGVYDGVVHNRNDCDGSGVITIMEGNNHQSSGGVDCDVNTNKISTMETNINEVSKIKAMAISIFEKEKQCRAIADNIVSAINDRTFVIERSCEFYKTKEDGSFQTLHSVLFSLLSTLVNKIKKLRNMKKHESEIVSALERIVVAYIKTNTRESNIPVNRENLNFILKRSFNQPKYPGKRKMCGSIKDFDGNDVEIVDNTNDSVHGNKKRKRSDVSDFDISTNSVDDRNKRKNAKRHLKCMVITKEQQSSNYEVVLYHDLEIDETSEYFIQNPYSNRYTPINPKMDTFKIKNDGYKGIINYTLGLFNKQ
jgi:hypothetical protein